MKNILKDFIRAFWEVIKLPLVLINIALRRASRTTWHHLVLLVAAAVILTVMTLSTFLEVTSQPQFCGSCHLMQPYLTSWKTSSHAGISCMKCHARAGVQGYLETKFTAVSMLVNYATGLYKRSKPWAEIEDRNCLQQGCHETRLLEGKIKFGDVVFDHAPHLTETRRGRTLRCTSCHSQIVQGSHITVTASTCFLCHFKNIYQENRADLARCTRCHTSPPTGDSARFAGMFDHTTVLREKVDCQLCHQNMWQGVGEVRREKCGVCHSQAAHIDRIGDLEFIHDWHITKRKVDCQLCHDPIEHRQPDVAATVGNDCRACHESQHAPMLTVYEGTGSRFVSQPMPDIMQRSGVVCMSCHKNAATNAGAARVPRDACTPCHNANYFKLAKNWRAAFDRRIASLETALRGVRSHPQIEDARHDLALIKKGGAWHNPSFADSVLTRVSEVITSATGTPAQPAKLPPESQVCLSCHAGMADVVVKREFSPFDHRAHLSDRQIACSQCHQIFTPGEASHGKRLPVASSCQTCHHGELSTRQPLCAPCHVPSRNLFTGTLPGMPPEPSPMATADMTCTDCHDPAQKLKPPDAEFCLNCHEQQIVTDLEFVRGELVQALKARGKELDASGKLVSLDLGRAVHNPTLAKKLLEGK
jgi:nitrate/TMAO reductase-like tetraheme cytochrome c subunit